MTGLSDLMTILFACFCAGTAAFVLWVLWSIVRTGADRAERLDLPERDDE